MLVAIADVQIYKYCCSLERKHANELEHPTQAPNASTQRKHPTQPLMGATRLASEKYAAIFSRVRISLLFSIPTRDASPPLVLAFFKQSICPHK